MMVMMMMMTTIIPILIITITIINFVSVRCDSFVMANGRIERRSMWRRAINILVR
jgi:sorbitol-specific phosphotransferase system component IIC